MDKDIKELFGGNTVIIRCSCAEEVRTVAELAIEVLNARNISDTVDAVLRHNDFFYETSVYKWVKLNKSCLNPDKVVMSAFIPTRDKQIPKNYAMIYPEDFCVTILKQTTYDLSEEEFSDLFQELVS